MSEDPSTTRVRIADEQDISVDLGRVVAAAENAIASEGQAGELSILLVTSEAMRDLNARFAGIDEATDVLAFPMDGTGELATDQAPKLIGDIVLCPKIAAGQGGDLAEELDLLVTHGVLHLLGYAHHEEAEAATMRAKEFELTGRSGARAH